MHHVGGDEQIGRAVLALGLQALQQLVLAGGQQVDLHAGLLGELVQHRLQQVVLAGGIDVYFSSTWHFCGIGRAGAQKGGQGNTGKTHGEAHCWGPSLE
jgi:hypothetical protein